MCPVRAAAAVVRRLDALKAKGKVSDDAHIFTFASDTKSGMGILTTKWALQTLRLFVELQVDWRNLGFKPADIGLHSIRSSAAMAMYMNNISPVQIRLMGRWSSEAFLKYIRPQVLEFGSDVAIQMIQKPRWHHAPAADELDPQLDSRSAGSSSLRWGANGLPTQRATYNVWNAGTDASH
jgi:hypothetical protein